MIIIDFQLNFQITSTTHILNTKLYNINVGVIMAAFAFALLLQPKTDQICYTIIYMEKVHTPCFSRLYQLHHEGHS